MRIIRAWGLKFQHPCGGTCSRLGRLWLIRERNYTMPAIGSVRIPEPFLRRGVLKDEARGDAFDCSLPLRAP